MLRNHSRGTFSFKCRMIYDMLIVIHVDDTHFWAFLIKAEKTYTH